MIVSILSLSVKSEQEEGMKMMNNLDLVIINYKNLTPADKRIIQAKLSVLGLITNAKDEYKEDIKGKTALTRLMYESAIETADELESKIKEAIILNMAEMIDGYNHVVDDQDTDYFRSGIHFL